MNCDWDKVATARQSKDLYSSFLARVSGFHRYLCLQHPVYTILIGENFIRWYIGPYIH